MNIKNLYEVKYECNIDAHTVTAIAKVKNTDRNFIKFRNFYSYVTGDYFKTKKEFFGVARLKNGDSEDMATAKRIARCKALRQANRYYGKVLTDMAFFFFHNVVRETFKMSANAYSKAHDYDEEIQKLTKGE